MDLFGLGYVLVDAPRETVREWRRFSREAAGMESHEDQHGVVRVRMDERVCRFIVAPAQRDGFAIGWELPSRRAWEAARTELAERGIETEPLSPDDAALRRVTAAFRLKDPAGIACELFYGAHIDPVTPFISPVGSRFVTEAQGMGHATLVIGNWAETVEFYEQVMGMHLRETTSQKVAFLGANGRQHSAAFIGAFPDGAPPHIAHIMAEVEELDDVGRALDRCFDGAAPVTATLGKHWNDHMISFYMRTPSGWDMELGAGGRIVERSACSQVHQSGVGSSVWGHRVLLPDNTIGQNLGRML